MKSFSTVKTIFGAFALVIVVVATLAQADPPATRTCKGCVQGAVPGSYIYLEFTCPGTQQCCYTRNENQEPVPECSDTCNKEGTFTLYACPPEVIE